MRNIKLISHLDDFHSCSNLWALCICLPDWICQRKLLFLIIEQTLLFFVGNNNFNMSENKDKPQLNILYPLVATLGSNFKSFNFWHLFKDIFDKFVHFSLKNPPFVVRLSFFRTFTDARPDTVYCLCLFSRQAASRHTHTEAIDASTQCPLTWDRNAAAAIHAALRTPVYKITMTRNRPKTEPSAVSSDMHSQCSPLALNGFPCITTEYNGHTMEPCKAAWLTLANWFYRLAEWAEPSPTVSNGGRYFFGAQTNRFFFDL